MNTPHTERMWYDNLHLSASNTIPTAASISKYTRDLFINIQRRLLVYGVRCDLCMFSMGAQFGWISVSVCNTILVLLNLNIEIHRRLTYTHTKEKKTEQLLEWFCGQDSILGN